MCRALPVVRPATGRYTAVPVVRPDGVIVMNDVVVEHVKAPEPAMTATEALNSLELLSLPSGATIVLGLLLGELSKWLNSQKLGKK